MPFARKAALPLALLAVLALAADPTRGQDAPETTAATFVDALPAAPDPEPGPTQEAEDRGSATPPPSTPPPPSPPPPEQARAMQAALLGATPGPADLPLHSWERAEAAWKRQQLDMLAEEEEAAALAEQVQLLRQRRQPGSWAGRAELTARQAAALLAEELAHREDAGLVDAEPAEETITTPPLMRRPGKKVRVKKVRRQPELAVVPQPHMLDGAASTTTASTPVKAAKALPEVTRVRRQHGSFGPSGPRPPPQRVAADDDGGDSGPDQDLEESRVKRHGHVGSTGPVHSFVKTDKHGHYKWGVRHHVGHHFA